MFPTTTSGCSDIGRQRDPEARLTCIAKVLEHNSDDAMAAVSLLSMEQQPVSSKAVHLNLYGQLHMQAC